MKKKPNKRQQARLDQLVSYVRERGEQTNFECVTVEVGERGLFHRKEVALALKREKKMTASLAQNSELAKQGYRLHSYCVSTEEHHAARHHTRYFPTHRTLRRERVVRVEGLTIKVYVSLALEKENPHAL